jgi:hypothetical protein
VRISASCDAAYRHGATAIAGYPVAGCQRVPVAGVSVRRAERRTHTEQSR